MRFGGTDEKRLTRGRSARGGEVYGVALFLIFVGLSMGEGEVREL